jgi:hypothetical protein
MHIMKSLLLLPIFAFPLILAEEPTVTLAGVQVVMDDAGEDFDGFQTFNMKRGHKVVLIVRSKGKAMVGFDDEKSSITLGGAKADINFFSNVAFSKDRMALKLEFHTSDPVSIDEKGNFKVAGALPLVLAGGKSETRSEAFGVDIDAEVKFAEDAEGMPTMKVKSIGKPDYGDAEFEIVFSMNRKMEEFAGMQFYTKEGVALKSQRTGSSWFGFGKQGSGEVTYQFEKKPTDLILAVETWTEREEISLKVDVDAGVALAKP